MATFAEILLLSVTTASMASGIPCPLILGVPYFAMTPTIKPPRTGMTMTIQPSVEASGLTNWNENR